MFDSGTQWAACITQYYFQVIIRVTQRRRCAIYTSLEHEVKIVATHIVVYIYIYLLDPILHLIDNTEANTALQFFILLTSIAGLYVMR